MRTQAVVILPFLALVASTPIKRQNGTQCPAFALQDYSLRVTDTSSHRSQFQISDGVAGTAQAEANAVGVDPFAGCDLSTVDATSLSNLKTMREAAETAETAQFDPAIDSATGATKDALNVGKIKNKVLKLTLEIQADQIDAAQGNNDGSEISAEQTKLDTNVQLDTASAGQTSQGVKGDTTGSSAAGNNTAIATSANSAGAGKRHKARALDERQSGDDHDCTRRRGLKCLLDDIANSIGANAGEGSTKATTPKSTNQGGASTNTNTTTAADVPPVVNTTALAPAPPTPPTPDTANTTDTSVANLTAPTPPDPANANANANVTATDCGPTTVDANTTSPCGTTPNSTADTTSNSTSLVGANSSCAINITTTTTTTGSTNTANTTVVDPLAGTNTTAVGAGDTTGATGANGTGVTGTGAGTAVGAGTGTGTGTGTGNGTGAGTGTGTGAGKGKTKSQGGAGTGAGAGTGNVGNAGTAGNANAGNGSARNAGDAGNAGNAGTAGTAGTTNTGANAALTGPAGKGNGKGVAGK